MSERLNMGHLNERVQNVNRRMEEAGSANRVQIQQRNGYVGLDLFRRDPDATINLPDSVPGRGYGWICQSTITVGTKREVGEFLHAMMVGIDLSRTNA